MFYEVKSNSITLDISASKDEVMVTFNLATGTKKELWLINSATGTKVRIS